MGITAACGRSLLQAQDLQEADEAAGRSSHESTTTPLDTTLACQTKMGCFQLHGTHLALLENVPTQNQVSQKLE